MIIYVVENFAIGELYMGTVHTIRSTAKCPDCKLPMIVPLKKESLTARDWGAHTSHCPLKSIKSRGLLMTKAYQKVLGFSRTIAANVNRKKFAEEWGRIDNYWKELMIVCPECFSFEIPTDKKVRPCPDCKCMMEWAKELVENDPRFNFAKEFCAAD